MYSLFVVSKRWSTEVSRWNVQHGKSLTFNYFLLAIIVLCSSCSENDSVEDVSILGEWELTEWRIGLEADINKDSVASYNLLDEIECNNQELITVEEESYR